MTRNRTKEAMRITGVAPTDPATRQTIRITAASPSANSGSRGLKWPAPSSLLTTADLEIAELKQAARELDDFALRYRHMADVVDVIATGRKLIADRLVQAHRTKFGTVK